MKGEEAACQRASHILVGVICCDQKDGHVNSIKEKTNGLIDNNNGKSPRDVSKPLKTT
jgi:hypothetical protein